MAQAFVSTYKNHYRWHWQPKQTPCDPDKMSNLQPEGDGWSLNLNFELDEELADLPKIKQAIHNLYLKRMQTTYRISYCERLKHSIKPLQSENLVSDQLENQLLEYCKKVYGIKHKKPIPPLNSARNVFGYMRPERLMSSLSNYQNEYGRVAYRILIGGKNIDEDSAC